MGEVTLRREMEFVALVGRYNNDVSNVIRLETGMSEIPTTVSILVYSDDANVRREIMTAAGNRVAKGQAGIVWKEVATPEMVMFEAEQTSYDLLILDAEAPKLGGMGLGKMVHDEVDAGVPFILYVARPQDEWLARWAGAEKILSFPVDGRVLSAAVAEILG